MPKASNPGSHRALATCPKCGDRKPKEVVGKGSRLRLYCANCGNDFPHKEKQETASLFPLIFAMMALIFAVLVVKRIQQTGLPKIGRDTLEERGLELGPGGNLPLQVVESGKHKAPATPIMSASERDIRKQWGWDTKGTSLNRPPERSDRVLK